MSVTEEGSGSECRTVLLTAQIGSRNNGLSTEGSDSDLMVFVAPTFRDLFASKRHTFHTIEGDVDVAEYDIRRLPELVRKANPAFLEVMFSEHRVADTAAAPYVRAMMEMRDRVAAMNLPVMWDSGMGVHHQKMAKAVRPTPDSQHLFDSHGYNTKEAMRAMRVLRVLSRFAESGFSDYGGAMRADPAEREYLLSIRDGGMGWDEFQTAVSAQLAETERWRDAYKGRPFDHEADDRMEALAMDAVASVLEIPVPGGSLRCSMEGRTWRRSRRGSAPYARPLPASGGSPCTAPAPAGTSGRTATTTSWP